VPGTAHGIESPCFCNGCLQRASGDAIDDHQLVEQIPPATAAGRARRLEGQYQLPLLGTAA
jgi:hypothetical protein